MKKLCPFCTNLLICLFKVNMAAYIYIYINMYICNSANKFLEKWFKPALKYFAYYAVYIYHKNGCHTVISSIIIVQKDFLFFWISNICICFTLWKITLPVAVYIWNHVVELLSIRINSAVIMNNSWGIQIKTNYVRCSTAACTSDIIFLLCIIFQRIFLLCIIFQWKQSLFAVLF
jgi:hypothetical protein